MTELSRNNSLPRAHILARIRKEVRKEASTGGISEHVSRGIARQFLEPPAALPKGFAAKGERLGKAKRRKSK